MEKALRFPAAEGILRTATRICTYEKTMHRKGVTQNTSPSVFIVRSIDKYGGAGQFQQRVDVTEKVVDNIGVTEGELIQQKYV